MKIIICPLIKEAKTGGEKYFVRVFEYFQKHQVCVEPLYAEELPSWPRAFGLMFDCFMSNIWFFFKLISMTSFRKETIILEDFHSHPRLVLCNALLKIFNKNIRIVTLLQLSLFYHGSLKNPLMKKLDEWVIRHYLRQTDEILCNSEYTRQQALSVSGVAAGKVKVVYCGHDELDVQPYESKTKDKINILFF
ncbi:MAG: glycosyltransferase family 4 protein [candidate division Zixibacteria bacterium]|nr:glycosyltransferase family 4 protein [candidate division Zixibacteria bacterium]